MESVFITDAWKETAQQRADFLLSMHKNTASSKKLVDDRELLGQMGEIAMHLWSGLHMPELNRDPVGDKGRDIVLGGYSIDVKAARHDGNGLLVRKGHTKASLYVLAIWPHDQPHSVDLAGWATRRDVEEQPPEKHVYTESHKVVELRGMERLAKFITTEKAKGY